MIKFTGFLPLKPLLFKGEISHFGFPDEETRAVRISLKSVKLFISQFDGQFKLAFFGKLVHVEFT